MQCAIAGWGASQKPVDGHKCGKYASVMSARTLNATTQQRTCIWTASAAARRVSRRPSTTAAVRCRMSYPFSPAGRRRAASACEIVVESYLACRLKPSASRWLATLSSLNRVPHGCRQLHTIPHQKNLN